MFHGKITSFHGKIRSFHDQITIFHGKIRSFHGTITSFHGKITSFHGKISIFSRQLPAVRSTHQALRPLPVLRAPDSGSEALGVVLREAVVQGVAEAQKPGSSPAKMDFGWILDGLFEQTVVN